MSYYEKYLKYKNKYLELKNLLNLQYGGDKPVIRYIDQINLFTDPEMEAYLNPIYGLSGKLMTKLQRYLIPYIIC